MSDWHVKDCGHVPTWNICGTYNRECPQCGAEAPLKREIEELKSEIAQWKKSCEANIEENVTLRSRIAEISTDWIVAQEQIRVLREALERIVILEHDPYKMTSATMRTIAKQALQRAGGGE